MVHRIISLAGGESTPRASDGCLSARPLRRRAVRSSNPADEHGVQRSSLLGQDGPRLRYGCPGSTHGASSLGAGQNRHAGSAFCRLLLVPRHLVPYLPTRGRSWVPPGRSTEALPPTLRQGSMPPGHPPPLPAGLADSVAERSRTARGGSPTAGHRHRRCMCLAGKRVDSGSVPCQALGASPPAVKLLPPPHGAPTGTGSHSHHHAQRHPARQPDQHPPCEPPNLVRDHRVFPSSEISPTKHPRTHPVGHRHPSSQDRQGHGQAPRRAEEAPENGPGVTHESSRVETHQHYDPGQIHRI